MGPTVGPHAAVGGFGKSFSQITRVAPHSLGLLQEFRDQPPVPVAVVGARSPNAFGGSLTAEFDASGSLLPAGAAAEYEWDFGDGATGTGKTASHEYADGGRYTVKLTLRLNGVEDPVSAKLKLPPRRVLQAPRDKGLLVEAETFSAQGQGEVKVAEKRVNASGPIITSWQSNIGHWLEWTVTPPAPGKYHTPSCGRAQATAVGLIGMGRRRGGAPMLLAGCDRVAGAARSGGCGSRSRHFGEPPPAQHPPLP